MKKIFCSLVALAALAACSKSEVEYVDQVEISFEPVSKINTKAAVNTNDYPDGLAMYIFANAGLDSDVDVNNTVDRVECTDTYLVNAKFIHRTELDENVFGGATPYYWPNVKSLWFAGVSASGNVNNGATPAVDFAANTISIPDYAPGTGTTTSGDNDLMYFVPVGPYSKAANAGTSIPVTMKHACSWITVKVAGNSVSGATNTTWEVIDLKIQDLALSGNLTVTAGEVTWEEAEANGEFGLKTSSANYALTQEYTDLLTATNAIVIPQAPATLYLKYQYVSQPAQGTQAAIVTTEETTIPLTYNGAAEWLPGYHYTYDLKISAEEILLTPSADLWIDYDKDSGTEGVQNPELNN